MKKSQQKASKAFIICLLVLTAGCKEDKPEIIKFSVIKGEKPLVTYKDAKTIEKVNNIISSSGKVDEATCKWEYELVTQYETGMNSRWLYCTEGFMANNSKRLYPIYKISDVETFNSLIHE